jgi:ABC-type glycerol-3-phosphate transport system permease component
MEMTIRTKTRLRNYSVIALMIIVAWFMLFPFTYMLSSSLKTPEDTFRVPPRLLPRDQVLVSIEGVGDDLPLFDLAGSDRLSIDSRGVLRVESGTVDSLQAALVTRNIRIGEYLDPRRSDIRYTLFSADIEPRGGYFDDQETTSFGGEEYGLWNVPIDGEIIPMIRLSQTAVGEFIPVDDPSRRYFANLRLSVPVERLAAHPENYVEVFELQGLYRSLTNTTLVTILVVAGQLLTSIMGGYAFARLKFPGRDQLFLLYLGTYMIPFVVLIIPLYQVMQALEWVNTTTALIVPWIFTVYGTFLMRQFFLAIPKELEEAAYIDGGFPLAHAEEALYSGGHAGHRDPGDLFLSVCLELISLAPDHHQNRQRQLGAHSGPEPVAGQGIG